MPVFAPTSTHSPTHPHTHLVEVGQQGEAVEQRSWVGGGGAPGKGDVAAEAEEVSRKLPEEGPVLGGSEDDAVRRGKEGATWGMRQQGLTRSRCEGRLQ